LACNSTTTSSTSAAYWADHPRDRAHGPGRKRAGVDISAPAIERAQELARAEGLSNVAFEHANAQVHRFLHERFNLAISRFGTMFFDDPGAAFANIRRALRPAGRLVMMVWQTHERNEWDLAIRHSLGIGGQRVGLTLSDRPGYPKGAHPRPSGSSIAGPVIAPASG
jgi:SAM-dependent methyltransferase